MLKNKKWQLLSTLMLASVLTLGACGNDSEGTTDDPADTTETGTGTDNGETAQGLPEMTTEDITLTYASWANGAFNQFMADQFMEKYPNINVEIVTVDQEIWNDGLTNLASAGQLPDVFWYQGNVDVPLINGWLGDLTPYWEADPESDDVLVTIKDQGYFDGERKMAAAVAYQPYTVFLDENLFNAQNVEMPSADWTYSEMTALMEEMTIPEQGIFGYNTYTLPLTMAPIVQDDAWGEFGWDGETYDLTGQWAEAAQMQGDYIQQGVHVPPFDTDAAEAAFGDRLLWAASTGKLAMQLDAWWTIGLFSTPEFVDKGINFVPYPVPQGDNAETQHKPAFIDFGSISAITEHPREAYELLKFMGWGSEGWEAKIEAFKTLTNENGDPLFTMPDGLPLIQNQAIWDEVEALLPQTQYVKDSLERMKEPIPLGGASQPGFQTFLEEAYFGGEYGNVEQAIINGEVNAADVAPNLTEMINRYRDEAMSTIFNQ